MKKIFMAFVTLMMAASVSAQFYIYLSNGEVLKADSISLIAPTAPTTNGMLPGEFSISTTAKVHFAQGNLQYVGTWQFAENQWECFGHAQYDNHRDLFGFGTGYTPNNVSASNYDYSTFVDWGVNPITNGGNQAGLWRTLTKQEWIYIVYNRANAAMLLGMGTVNGVNGFILLPDNWVLPAGASFIPGTMLGLVDQGKNYLDYNNSDHFADNTYSAVEWAVMESAGAVFFPAAGNNSNTGTYRIGEVGYYWATTTENADYAYYFCFESYFFGPQYYGGRRYGRSVRLVR